MKQLALDIAAPEPPTLDNFVAGRNAELVEHLRLLAAGGAAERFVYLWGVAGSGRSHLLQGAVAAMREQGVPAAYLARARGEELRETAGWAGCVALDDVERLDAEAQIAAFHLYNALRERRCALVAAGTAPPVQLALREDLVTRLAWGLVYQVNALTDEDKGRALDLSARARGFDLPPEVRNFMLTRAPRDLASLLGMLDALDRQSLEQKRPVSVPMVRELLARRRETGTGPQDAPGSAG